MYIRCNGIGSNLDILHCSSSFEVVRSGLDSFSNSVGLTQSRSYSNRQIWWSRRQINSLFQLTSHVGSLRTTLTFNLFIFQHLVSVKIWHVAFAARIHRGMSVKRMKQKWCVTPNTPRSASKCIILKTMTQKKDTRKRLSRCVAKRSCARTKAARKNPKPVKSIVVIVTCVTQRQGKLTWQAALLVTVLAVLFCVL